MKAIYKQGIITEIGQIDNADIDSIQILKPGSYSKEIQERYLNTAWKMRQPWEKEVANTSPKEAASDISALEHSIEMFHKDRQPAKVLEMLGAMAITSGLIMQAIYNQQYKKDLDAYTDKPTGPYPKPKYVPAGIYIGGGAALVIGFSIDVGAGSSLKRRK